MARWSFTDRDMKVIGRYALAHDLTPELSVAAEQVVNFRQRTDGKPRAVSLKAMHGWWADEKLSKKEKVKQ